MLSLLLALTAPALGSDLIDVTLSCPPYDGVQGNDPALGATTQATPASVPFGLECAVYIGNTSGQTLSAVDISIDLPSVTLPHTSATLLPDGIPGWVTTPPFELPWQFAESISAPDGFEAPVLDLAAQRLSWSLADVTPGTMELRVVFDTTEDTSDHHPQFPAGTYALTLDAVADGDALDEVRTVPIEVNLGRTPRLDHDIPSNIPRDGRWMTSAQVGRVDRLVRDTAWWGVQTHARLQIFLPYWDGVEVRADGQFDPLVHTPAIDVTTLDATLKRRSSANRGRATISHEEVVFDPLTLASGRPTGPATGPNAHAMLGYDPDTHTLSGGFGALGLGNILAGADEDNHHWWVLNWTADPDPAVIAAIPPDVNRVDVAACLSSDQSTAALGRAVEPSDEAWCSTRQLLFGDRNQDAKTGLKGNLEEQPLEVGQVADMGLGCRNLTDQTRDAEIYAQIPGDGQRQGAFESARLWPSVEAVPEAIEQVTIWVSTTPSVYGEESDLTARGLPHTAPGDWVACLSSDGSNLECTRSDVQALGLDPDAIEEVRFTLEGQRPEVLTYAEIGSSCGITLKYRPLATARPSINETAPCGAGDVYDPDDMTQASVGAVARHVSTLANGVVLDELHASNAELSSETRTRVCASVADSDGSFVPAEGCANVLETTLGQRTVFAGALRNVGQADNLFAPYQACLEVPVGFELDNSITADPTRPGLWIRPDGETRPEDATPVDVSRYTHSYDPSTRRLCIDVPSAGDDLDTIDAGQHLYLNVVATPFPGVQRSNEIRIEYTAFGYDTCGDLTLLTDEQSAQLDLTLVPQIRVSGSVEPEEIGVGAESCRTVSVSNPAYAEDGSTSNPTAGSAREAVVYVPITRTGDHPTVDMGGAVTRFSEAILEDADAVWLSTADRSPGELGSTLDPLHTDAATGFVRCASTDRCTLAEAQALGVDVAQIRWVAFTYAAIPVTDAEPRGTAPRAGADRVERPLQSTVCFEDAGSVDGAVFRAVAEFRSMDTAAAAADAIELDVLFNGDCIDVPTPSEEVCNGLDDDCDTVVDDDLVPPPGSLQNGLCLDSVQVCTDQGWVDPDYSALDPDGDGLCELCTGDDATGDTDDDGVCDDLDACAGDDATGDVDLDGVCEDLDLCTGDDALGDSDDDGLCDDLDACVGDDALGDTDGDGVCDDLDACVGDDATGNADGDGVCDDLDACFGDDSLGDADLDGSCDDQDLCQGDDTTGDVDVDGVCDDLDACFGDDSLGDADLDGSCDDQDLCLGDDTTGDVDVDGVCDDLDLCFGDDATGDADADGTCDNLDLCDGDDAAGDVDGDGICDDNCAALGDADNDGVCDPSDLCEGDDAIGDDDGDGVCNDLDLCLGDDAAADTDGDGVCQDVDLCIGDDATGDSDGDTVCDDLDQCLGNDDTGDDDADGLCDDLDPCFGDDSTGDSDADGICDDVDVCDGVVDVDTDGDGLCDDLDPCPADATNDSDFDGVCDGVDLCEGDDATGDTDGDGLCDDRDICFGDDALGDSDEDGSCDDEDLCEGDDRTGDPDGDGLCTDIDPCPLDAIDADEDGVCDSDDRCFGDNSTGDDDGDAVCNDLDLCRGDDASGDADGDGLCADFEDNLGTSDNSPDTDGDALDDPDELDIGTNPTLADTDNGGVDDGTEVEAGTNPLDPVDDNRADPDKGACGCQSSPGGGWLGLVLLLVVRRRR